jgi:hypothetical protein
MSIVIDEGIECDDVGGRVEGGKRARGGKSISIRYLLLINLSGLGGWGKGDRLFEDILNEHLCKALEIWLSSLELANFMRISWVFSRGV